MDQYEYESDGYLYVLEAFTTDKAKENEAHIVAVNTGNGAVLPCYISYFTHDGLAVASIKGSPLVFNGRGVGLDNNYTLGIRTWTGQKKIK